MTGVTAGRPPLFTSTDKLWVGALEGAGAVVIGLSWFFAAGRPDAGDQLLFVSLSLVGGLLGMSATASILLRGRRAVSARTRLLLGVAPATPTDTLVSAELVAGPDARWFHRSDCPLVEGRQWPPAPLSAHLGAGRRACPACKPGPRSEGQPE
jgi:hypothetical protein